MPRSHYATLVHYWRPLPSSSLLHSLILCFSLLCLSVPTLADASATIKQQRNYYSNALQALQRGDLKTYHKYHAKLDHYPLQAYLDYQELSRRLNRLPYTDVDHFLDRFDNTYMGDNILKAWLGTLAQRHHWHDYRSYYQERLDSVVLQCYWLQSRINTGDATAYHAVGELWNVGKSQPDECTPLFKLWISKGHLTQDIAWQRHYKALEAGQTSLAQYIRKQLHGDTLKKAELLAEVSSFPERLQQQNRFAEQSPYMQQIILHGIRRYARKDSPAALQVWSRYDAQQLFADEPRRHTLEYLAEQLSRNGHSDEAEQLIAGLSELNNLSLTEAVLRDALRQQDWSRVQQWINRLPATEQQTPRWLYWRARTMEQLGINDPAHPTPKQIYTTLAMERDFYGFLSADILGRDYMLRDQPVSPPKDVVTALAARPEIQRIREFMAVNQVINARREWHHMTTRLDDVGHTAAAQLAGQWGWHRQSILSMAAARSWDDLQLRFPLAFPDQINTTASKLNMHEPLLYAIARQESAFAEDARSPVGALGLMQLMPRTAEQTARQAGIKLRPGDLLKPEHNVALGSFYLKSLLKQYKGNRILAAAAYNAGPGRVKGWLTQDAQQAVPYDIWIESIPFKETRGYVQNILSYSVIYSYRLGHKQSDFVSADEASRKL